MAMCGTLRNQNPRNKNAGNRMLEMPVRHMQSIFAGGAMYDFIHTLIR
jgi:hypothetical protein